MLEYINNIPSVPHGQRYVEFSYAPSFDSVAVGITEGHKQRVENDRFVTSYTVYPEVLQSFKYTCYIKIFQYISNKMQLYTVYLYLATALHVSGGTSTHHQERIQLYLQHLVFFTPLLLPAAIVEELDRAR